MRVRRLSEILVVVMAANVASAQEGWKKKPYGEWNKQDIIKLGSDSPWAQVRHSDASIGSYGSPTLYMQAATIQLRSALPIRQALVRLKQLEQKYDKMNDKQRAEFDANTRGMLDCAACADNYIIALGPPVTLGAGNTVPGSNAINPLRDTTLGMLQKRVYIANDRGEHRELIRYEPPMFSGDEALFFFPRFDKKGLPLLTPQSKKLIFFFDSSGLRTGYGPVSIPTRFEFDVAKMVINGKVEF